MTIRQKTLAFSRSDTRAAVLHLALSLVLGVAALALGAGWRDTPALLLLAVPLNIAANVRLFAVQHDNGHLSYFASRSANLWCGVLLGAFTANAFHTMRFNHNRHHAYIGNLDEMEHHEVMTWTVRHWQAASPLARLGYRLYRSPLSLCLLGPIYVFFIRYRLPRNALRVGLWDCALQNLLMGGLWGLVWLALGWPGLSFVLIGATASAITGTLMVYTGHNHEQTYWQSADAVEFEAASLQGASVLDLGPVFDFMTFNFAYHDLHHLNARIPCYALRRCHHALKDDLHPTRLGLWDALASLQWKLWDEEKGRMVRFADAPPPDPDRNLCRT